MLHLPDECAQEVGHHEFLPPRWARPQRRRTQNRHGSQHGSFILIVICDHSTHDPHRLPDT
jgi:hypothetical protein